MAKIKAGAHAKNATVTANDKHVLQEKEHIPSRYSGHLKFILLLAIVSFGVYANTIKNGFVLDDHAVIKDNYYVTRGISAIPEILLTPYHKGWLLTNFDNLYRPLSVAVFAVEYELFKLSPAPYHVVCVIVFTLCVLLFFLFTDKLLRGRKTFVAFIAALLFALHPIHTEVVANIKSMDELLCFFFSLLSLIVFIRYTEQGKPVHLFTGCLCFLLSVLSKETSITLIAIIPLVFFFYRNENKKKSAYITSGVVITAILYFIMRYMIFRAYPVADSTIDVMDNALADKALSWGSRTATAILILGYYIRLLFIPYPLLSDYSLNSIPYTHFSSPWVLLSITIYIFLIAFSIRALLRRSKDLYAFGVLFFLVTLSLVANILFLTGTTMSERFLFFPSAGFCICVALFADQLASGSSVFNNKRPLWIVGVVCLIYAVITMNRNTEWQDNYTLYTSDAARSPNSARLNQYVADELLTNVLNTESNPDVRRKIIADATTHLYKAISICPNYSNALGDLGLAYIYQSRYDSAETYFIKALRYNPTSNVLMSNLARLYFSTKNYQGSIDINKKKLAIMPNDALTHGNIAIAYNNMGKPDSAIAHAAAAMSIDPKLGLSYGIMADAYKSMNKGDSAQKYERIAQMNNSMQQ